MKPYEAARASELMLLAPSSGLVALDVVLRECALALPTVIARMIHRFMDPSPLLTTLKHAWSQRAGAAEMDALVMAHYSDLRLEAHERGDEWTPKPQPLPDAQTQLVSAIVMHAVRVGSVRVVEWALDTSSYLAASRVLKDACQRGNVAVVRAVQQRRRYYSVADEALLRLAAEHGHLDVFTWLATHSRSATPPSLTASSVLAARNGHVAILEWIHSARGVAHLAPSLLCHAAVHGERRVMEWIRDHHVPVHTADASAAIEAVVKARRYDELEWLHTTYPLGELSLLTLREMAANAPQCDVVAWLARRFPERYGDYIIHYFQPPDDTTSSSFANTQPEQRRWRRFVSVLRASARRALRRSFVGSTKATPVASRHCAGG